MDSNQLKCPMCGAQFNSQEEMDAHAKEMHNKKEEQQEEHAISCSKCGFKASSTRFSLFNVLEIPANSFIYSCDASVGPIITKKR